MRDIGDLLKELGFNPDSPLTTQKAFIRHLIEQANRMERPPSVLPVSNQDELRLKDEPASQKFEQLSFNFDDSKKTG